MVLSGLFFMLPFLLFYSSSSLLCNVFITLFIISILDFAFYHISLCAVCASTVASLSVFVLGGVAYVSSTSSSESSANSSILASLLSLMLLGIFHLTWNSQRISAFGIWSTRCVKTFVVDCHSGSFFHFLSYNSQLYK